MLPLLHLGNNLGAFEPRSLVYRSLFSSACTPMSVRSPRCQTHDVWSEEAREFQHSVFSAVRGRWNRLPRVYNGLAGSGRNGQVFQ